MELITNLAVEILFFSIIGFFTIYPLQSYFNALTEKFIASEVVYKTRSASMHYGDDYNLNGIYYTQIVQGKVKFVTMDISYEIEGSQAKTLFWRYGKITGPGGRLVNKDKKTIFNVVPVTGALTNP